MTCCLRGGDRDPWGVLIRTMSKKHRWWLTNTANRCAVNRDYDGTNTSPATACVRTYAGGAQPASAARCGSGAPSQLSSAARSLVACPPREELGRSSSRYRSATLSSSGTTNTPTPPGPETPLNPLVVWPSAPAGPPPCRPPRWPGRRRRRRLAARQRGYAAVPRTAPGAAAPRRRILLTWPDPSQGRFRAHKPPVAHQFLLSAKGGAYASAADSVTVL